jgi:hypothetical protein
VEGLYGPLCHERRQTMPVLANVLMSARDYTRVGWPALSMYPLPGYFLKRFPRTTAR